MATPKPPGLLVRYIQEKRCVVFVGAGLSAGAGLPTWKRLLLDIIGELASALSDGEDKAAELQRMVDQGKLLEVADYCKEQMGEGAFHRLLSERLRGDKEAVPETHRLLMRLPFSTWITTNYDKLLERAYTEERGGYPRVLTHRDTEPLGQLLFDGGPFILKAHGDIDQDDTVVLTSRDYSEIIHENPSFNAVFSSILLTKALLFVGYSLADPDFRLLLERQFTAFKGFVPDRYALMGGLGSVERDVLWRTARIRVLPYPEGQHGEVLNFLRLLKDAVSPATAPGIGGGVAPAAVPAPAPVAPPQSVAQRVGPPQSVPPRSPGASPGPVPSASPMAPPPAPATAPATVSFSMPKRDLAEEQEVVAHEEVVTEAFRAAHAVSDDALESFAAPVELGGRAPKSISPEPLELSVHGEGASLQVELRRGTSVLANGFMSFSVSLGEIQRGGFATFGGMVARRLPKAVRQALDDALSAEHAAVVLRLSPSVDRMPWELMPTQRVPLALRCPVVRAATGISESARGMPSIHQPLRVLLVCAQPEARWDVERLARLHQDAALSTCQVIPDGEASPERLLAELDAKPFDVIHLLFGAKPVTDEPSEAFLPFPQGRLGTNGLRSVLSRSPPALLVLDAGASAFPMPQHVMDVVRSLRVDRTRARSGFMPLAMQTGVGAFLGCMGMPSPEGAAAFALRLHQGLLQGETVAEAVFHARLETHRAFPDDPTALQYVLSGNGNLRLRS
jgi:hypothetical protein